jgi:tRNA G10  N-methylase Trm11
MQRLRGRVSFEIVHSEVLPFLRTQPDAFFDALLCDPPYGLRFMNKKWDYDVPPVALWEECARVPQRRPCKECP